MDRIRDKIKKRLALQAEYHTQKSEAFLKKSIEYVEKSKNYIEAFYLYHNKGVNTVCPICNGLGELRKSDAAGSMNSELCERCDGIGIIL